MHAEDQTQDVMLVQQTLSPQPMVTVPDRSLSLLHKLYISTDIHVQENSTVCSEASVNCGLKYSPGVLECVPALCSTATPGAIYSSYIPNLCALWFLGLP